MTALSAAPPRAGLDTAILGQFFEALFGHQPPIGVRIAIIIAIAILAHVAARAALRLTGIWVKRSQAHAGKLGYFGTTPKFDTVLRLIFSSAIFGIYFVGIGLVLEEFGLGITAYLASTSVLGLAISFGSQGLIQDIVIGLTLIFWDAMDVNDMVEIVGPTTSVVGRVEEIGMRFTKIVNFYGQKVLIPNRTIGNISRFPHGGVDAYADPQIPASVAPAVVLLVIQNLALGMWAQFGAIILAEPVIGRIQKAPGGTWTFVRVHFKIWPGQGGLIETTFREEVVRALNSIDPKYASWQVPVTYRAAIPAKAAK